MPIGPELKSARERAGLTTEDISQRTKIKLHKIEALESDDFDHLPTGFYLKGIIRAYAHEVSIDPEPLVERMCPMETPLNETGATGAIGAEAPQPVFSSPAPAPIRFGSIAIAVIALLAIGGWSLHVYNSARWLESNALTEAAEPAPRSARSQDTVTSPGYAPAETTDSTVATAGGASDVSGSWTLATHVESSSYARFEGLNLGYRLQLDQDGTRVSGTGHKVSENGDGIGRRAQTPIRVDGFVVDGDRLELTFTERGALRPSRGELVLLIDDVGNLRGRFSSTAARSSGTAEARRLN